MDSQTIDLNNECKKRDAITNNLNKKINNLEADFKRLQEEYTQLGFYFDKQRKDLIIENKDEINNLKNK